MGYLSAVDMREQAGDDVALRWHLISNHYPPLPESLLPVTKQVIDLARNEEWEELVTLPKGVSYRGKNKAPVSECVRAWHLNAFLSLLLIVLSGCSTVIELQTDTQRCTVEFSSVPWQGLQEMKVGSCKAEIIGSAQSEGRREYAPNYG